MGTGPSEFLDFHLKTIKINKLAKHESRNIQHELTYRR